MWSGRRFVGVLVTCGALAALLSSCVEAKVSMDLGGTTCIPARIGERVAFGDSLEFPESAAQSVILDEITIPGVPGVEAYILPIVDNTRAGAFSLDEPLDTWPERVPVEGYVLQPGAYESVVAVFPPHSDDIPLSSMTVRYHTQSGRTLTADSGSRVTVTSDRCA